MTTPAVPRLDVRRVSKTYGARKVLDGLSLTVLPGEMHGLVGQNGSGKSTFAKSISGYHAPDPGCEILVDGEALTMPVSPRDLRQRGVSIVHQDLGLIEDASVVENVRIAVMEGSRWARRIDWRDQRDAAAAALDRLGYDGPLGVPVRELSLADRARVAIGRAIQVQQSGGGLIIFDESTRALPAEALQEFYTAIDRLLSEGTGVLMIGHRLGEIIAHCDRVTVLRDGESVVAGEATEGLSESQLATRMLGHELRHYDFKRSDRSGHAASVRVRELEGDGLSRPLDLDLGKGEIVGLSGLPGSGFAAVPYLLAGARPARGTLEVDGRQRPLAGASVARLVRDGVVLVPADRPGAGLATDRDMLENTSLPWLSKRGTRWRIGGRWQREEAQHIIESLGVVPPDPRQLLARFSGGNAQKVLLGKWLMGGPRLLLLHEPTQGVDVNARLDLLGAVHRAAQDGAAVIVATTEPEDLVTVCDRVIFFADGAPTGELRAPLDVQQIVDATYSDEVKQARPSAAAATAGR